MKIFLAVVVLLGLGGIFMKAADWFQDTKGINIIPAALIEVVSAVIFVFNYGEDEISSIIWMCVAIAIVLAVTIFNLTKYGLKDGALASLAELVFSVSVVFIFLVMLLSGNNKTKRKNRRR